MESEWTFWRVFVTFCCFHKQNSEKIMISACTFMVREMSPNDFDDYHRLSSCFYVNLRISWKFETFLSFQGSNQTFRSCFLTCIQVVETKTQSEDQSQSSFQKYEVNCVFRLNVSNFDHSNLRNSERNLLGNPCSKK